MKIEEKVALLAKRVREVWERDDAACMRLFGNNTTAMLAYDVAHAFPNPQPERPEEMCPYCWTSGNLPHDHSRGDSPPPASKPVDRPADATETGE